MKNFSICYVVVRSLGHMQPVVIGTFRTLQGADDKAGQWGQEMIDRGIEGFSFSVQSTVYYDD